MQKLTSKKEEMRKFEKKMKVFEAEMEVYQQKLHEPKNKNDQK